MHFFPSTCKSKPCCFPLQEKCGYRIRKVVILLKYFKSQGTQISALLNRLYFLVLCREGFCRGTLALCPPVEREVVHILGVRTDNPFAHSNSEDPLCCQNGVVWCQFSAGCRPRPLQGWRETILTDAHLTGAHCIGGYSVAGGLIEGNQVTVLSGDA